MGSATDRTFSIDTQEQWKDVFTKVIKSERELVSKKIQDHF